MAARTITNFDSLGDNYKCFIRYKFGLDSYDKDKDFEGNLRTLAAKLVYNEYPNNPHRDSDRRHMLSSAPIEEVISVVERGKANYNDEIKPLFNDSTGIERLVSFTPSEVKDELKKDLWKYLPKDEEHALDPEAAKAHEKYRDFMISRSKLGSSDRGEVQGAVNKLAKMVNQEYDNALARIPENERAGYERLFRDLKQWTLHSEQKLMSNLQSIGEKLEKEYEDKVTSNFERHIKNNMGRKAVKKLYEEYFTKIMMEEQKVLSEVRGLVERNDVELKDYYDKEFTIAGKSRKYKDILKDHEHYLDSDFEEEIPITR